ncbi:hypothetical protein VTJ49DRAFT_3425 [Mycothermus thermophilus]|uniref:Mid2 domain-containing protein n=1 Tax=Humicola insolens TaxID=85995 RepID=A0ABR3V8I2_HUMIN
MRLLPLLAWLPTPALALMQFINPPKAGPVGDLRGIQTYEVGSFLEVIWTAGEPGKATSITLWQLDPVTTEWFGPLEYVIRMLITRIHDVQGPMLTQIIKENTVDTTSFSWVVGTRKDLSVSNLFSMSLFEAGQTSPDSNSRYFYIVRPGQKPVQPNVTTSSVARIQTVSTISTSARIPSATGTSTSSSEQPSSTSESSSSKDDDDNNNTSTHKPITTATEPTDTTPTSFPTDSARLTDDSSTSDGLTTTAKITIGILVPFGVILGAVVMYLWLASRRKRDLEAQHPPWSGQQQNVNVNLGAPFAGFYKPETASVETRASPAPDHQRNDGANREGSANPGSGIGGGYGYPYPTVTTAREDERPGLAELPGSWEHGQQ